MSDSSNRPYNPKASGPVRTAASMREDVERRRSDVNQAGLQQQVDELRQALRELALRQIRDNEVIKGQEQTIAQMRQVIDQLRQESRQSSEARALDENRTRQELADLEERIEDAIRPVRSLQAHVSELLEASRQKVDDTQQTLKRFEEIETTIELVTAVGDRTSSVSHSLRESIEGMRSEVDGLRRDIIRAEDAVKIVDQEGRRRASEAMQTLDGYSSRIDELRSDLGHLHETLEEFRRGLVHVDPSLDELRTGELQLRQELTRLQNQSNERHELVLESAEDQRTDTDARFEQLRQAIDERIDRLNERLEEGSEGNRQISFRVNDLNSAMEELKQTDASLHRDIWYLHEQRVRTRLEQVQEELDAVSTQRKEAENDGSSGARFRRRRAVISDSES